MASTVKSKTLRVTITEDIVLNGVNYSSENKVEFTGIKQIYKNIQSIQTDSVTKLMFFRSDISSSDSPGLAQSVDSEDVKYVRITNLSTTHGCKIVFQIETLVDDAFEIRLSPGESYILGNPKAWMLAYSGTSPDFGTMDDLDTIWASYYYAIDPTAGDDSGAENTDWHTSDIELIVASG